MLIGDARSASILGEYYTGTPIKAVDEHDQNRFDRPHSKSDCALLPQHASRKLLSKFAAHVRGDGRTAFGIRLEEEPFHYEQGHPDLSNLLQAAETVSMSNLINDIGDLCSDQPRLDKRTLAKMLGTMATDSPTVSYLPRPVAERVLSFLSAEDMPEDGSDSELQDALQLDAPLLFEFCLALDRMNNCIHAGEAMLSGYRAFLQCLAERSIYCGTGSPDVPIDDTLEAGPSSRSNECLRTGICSGVKQERVRKHCAVDRDRHADHWEGCRHKFVKGSRGSLRTDGIFTCFCKQGVCHRFYIMPDVEGRDKAFSFLFKYFKSAPKVVVYDFACALQDYCLI